MVKDIFIYFSPVFTSSMILIFVFLLEHSLSNLNQFKQTKDVRILSFLTFSNKYWSFNFALFAFIANLAVFSRYISDNSFSSNNAISLFIINLLLLTFNIILLFLIFSKIIPFHRQKISARVELLSKNIKDLTYNISLNSKFYTKTNRLKISGAVKYGGDIEVAGNINSNKLHGKLKRPARLTYKEFINEIKSLKHPLNVTLFIISFSGLLLSLSLLIGFETLLSI